MDAARVLEQLAALGSEQTRKTYRRHGARDPLRGVSYASFGKLCRTIRIDHALAQQLWRAGVYDGMVLATMVADPAAATDEELTGWAGDLYCYALSDHVAGYASKTALADALMPRWTDSSDEWVGQAGWHLVGARATSKDAIPDELLADYLAVIERDIHGAANYTRYAINNALIAIGGRNDRLECLVLDAARRIGKVQVDHGQTGCKTPDAAAYIAKMKARRSR